MHDQGLKLKAGGLKFVPASDPIKEPGRLRIELLGENGEVAGELYLHADVGLRGDDERRAVAIFAHHVDNAKRRVDYIRRFNSEQVYQELREDLNDWHLRQRNEEDRFDGIAPEKLRKFKLNQ